MKRKLIYFFASLFTLLLIILGIIFWIVVTESGLQFVVEQTQRFAPGELELESLEGRLIDEVSFTKLSYQYQDTVVQIDSFLFNWDIQALVDKKVHIEQLHVSGINMSLPKGEDKKEKESTPLEIPEIDLPITIAIDDVQINQVSIKMAEAEPFIIDSIELRSTTSDTLSLQTFQVKSPQLNAKLVGDVDLKKPHTVQLDLDWTAQLPDFTVVGQGELSGNLQQLVLNHTISKPLEVELKGTFKDVLGALSMDTVLTWQEIYWPLNVQNPSFNKMENISENVNSPLKKQDKRDFLVHSQQGKMTLTGTLDNYLFDLKTKVTGKQIPTGEWTIVAEGNQQAVTIKKLHAKILKGTINAIGDVSWQPQLIAQLHLNVDEITVKDFWQDWPDKLRLNSELIADLKGDNFKITTLANLPKTATQLSITGDGVLAGENTRFNTKLTWQEAQWPLISPPLKRNKKDILVVSPKGEVNVTGTINDYHVDLKTQFVGAQIPKGFLTLKGQGNLQQFTIKSLNTKLLKGAINATGQVNWKSQLAAQLNLDVDKISIKKFWKDWPDKLRINSQLKANLEGNDFQINTLKVSLPKTAIQLFLQGKGKLAGENTRFDSQLTWKKLQWPLIGNKSLVFSKTGKINLAGTLQKYSLNLETHLAGETIPPAKWNIVGQGNTQQFTVKSFHSKILKGTVKATGKVSWQPKLAANLNLNINKITVKDFWKDWPNHLRVNSNLAAKLDGQDFKIEQLNIKLPKTATQLSLKGKGSLAGKEPRFDATLAWQSLQWPLVDKIPLVNTKKGTLHAKGTPQAYQLRLNTDIEGKDIPKGRWKAVGQGDSRHLKLKSVQSKILQGTLNLTGQVAWQPEVNWQLKLKGKRLNPGKQWTEWPGKIALDIQSEGKLKNGKLDTQVQIKKVKGKLRGYPLLLQTKKIAIKDNAYTINRLKFQSGKTLLTVNGQLGKNSKLDWNLKAPNLAALLPDAKGSFTGNGQITGPLHLPHITAKLNGKSLKFQDNSLKTLQADANINLLTGKNLRLNITAKNFKQGTTQIERFSLQGKGSIKKHTLVASMRMPKDRFSLQLKGGFKQPRWQGKLQQLTASSAKAGYWQLQSPTTLKLSTTEAQLARSCLQNAKTVQFCTQLNWQKNANSTVNATLTNLPLNIIHAFLPEDTELTGIVNGVVNASLRPNGILKSDAMIKISPGTFKALVDEEKVKTFHHKGGILNLKITQRKGLAADLKLSLLKQSQLKGTFNLPRFKHLPPVGKQPLQGRFEANIGDLSILPAFVPQAENTKGKVNLDVKLNGTLAKPKIQGLIRVANAATDLPDLGLELKKLNVEIKNKGQDTLQLDASVNSGEGKLTVDGKIKLFSFTDWKTDLKIRGKNFEATNMPDAWALVSPKIDVAMKPGYINVTGDITIPEAAITPTFAGSGAVSVSDDVVIVNPKNPIEKKQEASGWDISNNVKIILGENVTFEAAGFKSRFGGSLLASNNQSRRRKSNTGKPKNSQLAKQEKITIGNGELYILNGSYRAYGQNLKIDKGRVTFTGGPIENPGLDIRAYRRIKRQGNDDVIAGVHIHGTAQSPKITLFSEPTLDQSNTLSYIILGKPVAQATEGEGKSLLSAAIAMHLQEGDSLTQKIGQRFGLDEAKISSEDGVGEAALVLGKYLAPGLYISYGIGLFDGSKVLRMRYELTKHLTLETETGTQSGVDLLYSIER
ncbi:translocation/assembly module TamB domain-containing protein [Candidatus Parabeggiatoa sp. HSG14]|uniref:translocation/assembly module TamB domain-containing protein n=1 Tax=Candidatus Parabeggiatoa sp. HSG14 TaxID=3055593 RepID=UPI0025A92C96|nr:translocation/assembly module TamB domain-containing protein [Thiotrichales bacterium HSG14]